jgi:hypothetical protein
MALLGSGASSWLHPLRVPNWTARLTQRGRYHFCLVSFKNARNEGKPLRGERAINEAEALIVRRIFREFAAGRSPGAIATDLNREGVPGPLGRSWGDTTIRGHVSRGTGILNNELYAGVLVWNRQRYVKDPSTGRRVSRPNPESEWIRTEVPDLRIVDDALWRAAKDRQAELAKQFEPTTIGVREARAKRIHTLRRPAFLLSGLHTCGCCAGKYGIIARNRYGCLNHYRRGTCDNNRTVAREAIERRALAGLQDKLVSADAVALAVRAYVWSRPIGRIRSVAPKRKSTAGPSRRSSARSRASCRPSKTGCTSHP